MRKRILRSILVLVSICGTILSSNNISAMDRMEEGKSVDNHQQDQWEVSGNFSDFYNSYGEELNRLFTVTRLSSFKDDISVCGYCDGSVKIMVNLRDHSPDIIEEELHKKNLLGKNYLSIGNFAYFSCLDQNRFLEFLSVFVATNFIPEHVCHIVINKINTEIPNWDIAKRSINPRRGPSDPFDFFTIG